MTILHVQSNFRNKATKSHADIC